MTTFNKSTKRPASAKKLNKAEAKAIVGGKNITGRANKSKLQSNTGIS
ncbi:MAG TPA: hypothetical protein PKL85_11290 [Bacteroidia bacterium]|nr:hypothetical protein [Bacteroidia bacterium]